MQRSNSSSSVGLEICPAQAANGHDTEILDIGRRAASSARRHQREGHPGTWRDCREVGCAIERVRVLETIAALLSRESARGIVAIGERAASSALEHEDEGHGGTWRDCAQASCAGDRELVLAQIAALAGGRHG